MGQPCETQRRVCDCVFACKLAVCVAVYTCAQATHSRVPVRTSDWCDSLHHRRVRGSHPCLCNLLHGDLHVWCPSVVRVAPISSTCGMWRRGRGSLLCVQDSRQHACGRDEAKGYCPTAVSKPATQQPFVVSWWRGTNLLLYSDISEMSRSFSPLTDGSQTCPADVSTSPLILTLLIASQALCVCG